jgi:hypothetical protein
MEKTKRRPTSVPNSDKMNRSDIQKGGTAKNEEKMGTDV